jgi:hypothetical protein
MSKEKQEMFNAHQAFADELVTLLNRYSRELTQDEVELIFDAIMETTHLDDGQ